MRLLKWLANLLVVATISVAAIPSSYAGAASPRLLVLYPQINSAYDAVFEEIIGGIREHPNVKYSVISVRTSTTHDEIRRQIAQNNIDAVIALGKKVYDFAHEFSSELPVIHGGLLLKPDGHSGVSLAGSPKEFFSQLANYAPGVKRVFTVYNETNSGWLIELANRAAAKHGVELVAYPAKDIRQAVKQFKNILDQSRDSSDAVWLLMDNVLPDKTIMPMALDVAWRRRVVLFSSNPSHTRRGALFSLFPDHYEMGNSLAALAVIRINQTDPQPLVVPLDNLKISLNRRTASHLGFRYSSSLIEKLDLVYPVR